jgi:hypothetical protein
MSNGISFSFHCLGAGFSGMMTSYGAVDGGKDLSLSNKQG